MAPICQSPAGGPFSAESVYRAPPTWSSPWTEEVTNADEFLGSSAKNPDQVALTIVRKRQKRSVFIVVLGGE